MYEEQKAQNEKISKDGSRRVFRFAIAAALFVLLFLGLTGAFVYNKVNTKESLTVSIIDKVNAIETKINAIDGEPRIVETTKIIDNTIDLTKTKNELKAEIISDLVKQKTIENCVSVRQPGDTEFTYTCKLSR